MAFSGGEVKRRVKASEGGVLGEARVAVEQHLRLHQITVPRRRDQPLSRRRAPKRIPHLSLSLLSSQRPLSLSVYFCMCFVRKGWAKLGQLLANEVQKNRINKSEIG